MNARLAKEAIKIPNRIERGPTDILKALASTIKYLPGEPSPFLQDDPYLLPTKPFESKLYIISKLSGIKTARFILHKYPELFFRDDAEPKIEAYSTPEQFTEDMEFTEEDIKWCIDKKDIKNALVAYKVLDDKGVKLSEDVLLQFYELVSYTNEERILDIFDHAGVRLLATNISDILDTTWKKNGLATKIFNKIKDEIDPPRVYSIMIAALVKHNEYAMANEIFQDFRKSHPKDSLYLDAYNGLLISIMKLNSSVETAQNALEDIVGHMRAHLVKPDLKIFNSILTIHSYFQYNDDTVRDSLRYLNDMKNLGIEPSLTTLSMIIKMINGSRSALKTYGNLIPTFLNYIKLNPSLVTVRDSRDVYCLKTLMKDFSRRNNLKHANQLHQIYLKNPNLFHNEAERKNYLNNYFKIILTFEPLEKILDFYNTHKYLDYEPSADLYSQLGEALDLYQAPEEIIQDIFNDMVKFKVLDRITDLGIFKKYSDKMRLDEMEKLDK